MLHNNPGNLPDPMPPMGEPLPPPQIRRHPGAPMTDTTNHAMHPRHDPLCNASVLGRACDCGLDALTREAEGAKGRAPCGHPQQALVDDGSGYCLWCAQIASSRYLRDELTKTESTIASQSARIATLEEALGELVNRRKAVSAVHGRDWRGTDGRYERAAAALAPSKGER